MTASTAPQQYRIRGRHLVTTLFVLGLLALLMLQSRQQAQLFQSQQQQQQQQMIKEQLTLAVVLPMEQNNQQQLQWLAQSFTRNPLIQTVWIHQQDGSLMAESGTQNDNGLILVAEINNGEVLGYIRISLNKALFLHPLKQQQEQQFQWHQLTLLLAGIIGILLSRCFSQLRQSGS